MQKVKLGDIGVFKTGGTPSRKSSNEFQGNIPWITTVALNNNFISDCDAIDYLSEAGVSSCATKIISPFSLMIGIRVGVGKCAVNKVPMCTSQDIVSIENIDETKFNLSYLLKFVQSKIDEFDAQKRGATIKGVTTDFVKTLEFPFLTLEEQKAIAEKLDKVSILIEKRKQQLSILDTLVKSKFVEMFGMIGKDEKGWGIISLGDICFFNPKKSENLLLKNELEVSFVPMTAVSEKGEIDGTDVKTYEQVQKGFTYFVENDVLFAKITPCMENGKGAVACGLKNGIGFGSTEFHVMRPKNGICNPTWLYTVTSFKEFRQEAARNMTGSAGQRRVPVSFLSNYKISLPPLDLQNQFANFVKQTEKTKAKIKQGLAALELLKKSLMQKYFG